MKDNNGDNGYLEGHVRYYRQLHESTLEMWKADLEHSDELEDKVRDLANPKRFQKELSEMIQEEEKKCVCSKCWKPMLWASVATSLVGIFLH